MSSTTINDTGSSTSNGSREPQSSIVDAVFDTTLAWVDTALGHVKASLAYAGRALIRSARAVDGVRERLRA
jgi:hypothetical protein